MANQIKVRLTPDQRKKLVIELREEHEDYFQTIGNIQCIVYT